MNATRCRIVIGPDDTRAYVPYDGREIVKRLPTRHWDKALRCWIIPTTSAGQLHSLLAAAGWEVGIIRLGDTPQTLPAHERPARSGLAAARAAAAAAAAGQRDSNSAPVARRGGGLAAARAAAAAARRNAGHAA